MLGIKIDFDKRIYGFDLLRAFAIFCVVHGHGNHLLEGTALENFPWFELPHGVDIFFVLSGFLIGSSFITLANKNNGAINIQSSLGFWKRSAIRILPNYFLILAINYILVNLQILPGTTEKFSILLFITFTQNLFYPFYDFFWESWSLATQEWFYLLFPIMLIIFSRLLGIKKGIILISALFILIALAYRYSIHNVGHEGFWWDINFRKVTASRIDCVFFGVLAAWVRYYLPAIWNKYAIHSFLIGILMFLIVSYSPRIPNTMYTNIIFLTLAPIYITLWFPLIDKLKNAKTIIGRLITVISILSYSIYLLNLMIAQIIDKNYKYLLSNHAILKYLLYLSITLIGSYILYQLVENPISKYKVKMQSIRLNKNAIKHHFEKHIKRSSPKNRENV